jgi:DNA topoisomerase 2-associated protein PAT1
MRKFEKDLIAKIQISNLVSDDPYANDYYYQIYTAATASDVPVDPKKKWQQSLLTNQLVGKGNSVSVTDQMQKQMKKLVENRKQKPPREGTGIVL